MGRTPVIQARPSLALFIILHAEDLLSHSKICVHKCVPIAYDESLAPCALSASRSLSCTSLFLSVLALVFAKMQDLLIILSLCSDLFNCYYRVYTPNLEFGLFASIIIPKGVKHVIL